MLVSLDNQLAILSSEIVALVIERDDVGYLVRVVTLHGNYRVAIAGWTRIEAEAKLDELTELINQRSFT